MAKIEMRYYTMRYDNLMFSVCLIKNEQSFLKEKEKQNNFSPHLRMRNKTCQWLLKFYTSIVWLSSVEQHISRSQKPFWEKYILIWEQDKDTKPTFHTAKLGSWMGINPFFKDCLIFEKASEKNTKKRIKTLKFWLPSFLFLRMLLWTSYRRTHVT